MKYLIIVLVAIVSLTFADDEWKPVYGSQNLIQIRQDCKKKVGITDEQYELIEKFEQPDEKIFHNYVLCIVKSLGIFIDGKGFDADRVLSQVTSMLENIMITKDTLKHCFYMKEYENKPAEWAFHGHKCILDSEIGYLFREGRKKGHF